jgi:ubiquinol-cytochrome c reductase iron-sulfur subunit
MGGTSVQALGHEAESRRDFLKVLTASAGLVGLGATVWPFIDALGPDADSEAVGDPIINVAAIAPNSAITVRWNGLPIYIRKLTPQQIAGNKYVVADTLPDPAEYTDRVKPGYESFVVVVGLNTGTPCELDGNAPGDPRGPYDGWVCPCDGSVYDPLGRVRSGPATKNLAIPRFTFLDDAQLQLG